MDDEFLRKADVRIDIELPHPLVRLALARGCARLTAQPPPSEYILYFAAAQADAFVEAGTNHIWGTSLHSGLRHLPSG